MEVQGRLQNSIVGDGSLMRNVDDGRKIYVRYIEYSFQMDGVCVNCANNNKTTSDRRLHTHC